MNNFEIEFKKKFKLSRLTAIKKLKNYTIFEIFMIEKNNNKLFDIF